MTFSAHARAIGRPLPSRYTTSRPVGTSAEDSTPLPRGTTPRRRAASKKSVRRIRNACTRTDRLVKFLTVPPALLRREGVEQGLIPCWKTMLKHPAQRSTGILFWPGHLVPRKLLSDCGALLEVSCAERLGAALRQRDGVLQRYVVSRLYR